MGEMREMKKLIVMTLIAAIVIVLCIVYYNENIKTNTITDGTFVWIERGECE